MNEWIVGIFAIDFKLFMNLFHINVGASIDKNGCQGTGVFPVDHGKFWQSTFVYSTVANKLLNQFN